MLVAIYCVFPTPNTYNQLLTKRQSVRDSSGVLERLLVNRSKTYLSNTNLSKQTCRISSLSNDKLVEFQSRRMTNSWNDKVVDFYDSGKKFHSTCTNRYRTGNKSCKRASIADRESGIVFGIVCNSTRMRFDQFVIPPVGNSTVLSFHHLVIRPFCLLHTSSDSDLFVPLLLLLLWLHSMS